MVDRVPEWPVFRACNKSNASPPRTSPTRMRSGRWRRVRKLRRSRITRQLADRCSLRRAFVPGNWAESTSSLNWRRASGHASAMDPLPPPLAFFFLLVSGWVNRQQQAVIDYLLEENRVLRAAQGSRRLRLTDDERRRLAVKGKFSAGAAWRRSPASSHRTPFCAGIAGWWPRSTMARRGDGPVDRAPSLTSPRSSCAWRSRTQPGGTRGSATA